jgi:hypothetical protein
MSPEGIGSPPEFHYFVAKAPFFYSKGYIDEIMLR